MASKPKRKSTRVSSVNQLRPGLPREVLPIDQIAPYYGGRAGAKEATRQADALQEQVYPAMRDIDPEMAAMFPQFLAEHNYSQPSTMLPIDLDDPSAPLAEPVGHLDDYYADGEGLPESALPTRLLNEPLGAVVNIGRPARDFRLIDTDPSGPEAMGQMIEQPMTTNVTDPGGVGPRNYLLNEARIRGTPLINEDEASALARALTDNSGGDPQAIAEAIMDRSQPYRVDQALAQLRRTSGDPMGDMNDILLNAEIDARRAVNDGAFPGAPVGKTGLSVADLIALTSLPSRVKKFLPTRMGMTPGVMGATAAGAAAGQYGMSQDPNMIGRSTMGGANY